MTATINVLMFGWELPPYNSGGLGVACYGLTKGLAQAGVNVSFALPRRLPVDVSFMKVLDHPLQHVTVTALNAFMMPYFTAKDYESYANYYGKIPMYGASLYEESERFATLAGEWSQTIPHRIIHAHDWMTFPAGMKAKSVSGNPLVAHVHATEYDRTGGSVDSRIADMEYRGLSAADQIIAVSHYTKNMIQKYYSIPQEKITVVHNGIDPVDFSPQDIRHIFPHDHIVLYVGRLTYQKGVDHFLRAAKEVLQTHPNTVFLVVGNGDMYHKLIMDAAYLGIAHRVIFTGFLQGNKLKQMYQMANVFVMPSISEPYGLVALEAIASGVPTIISKQSGVSETLDHVHKVDFWDIQKMARLIRQVIDYPAVSKEMVKLAQQELYHHTWNEAAQKTLSVYHSLIE